MAVKIVSCDLLSLLLRLRHLVLWSITSDQISLIIEGASGGGTNVLVLKVHISHIMVDDVDALDAMAIDSGVAFVHYGADFIPQIKSRYKSFEDVFFNKVKDELIDAREHPFVAGGVALIASLLLMQGMD
ncbi:hypothetical protein CsSME_00042522 [Camellia sinensis var. sinensis]